MRGGTRPLWGHLFGAPQEEIREILHHTPGVAGATRRRRALEAGRAGVVGSRGTDRGNSLGRVGIIRSPDTISRVDAAPADEFGSAWDHVQCGVGGIILFCPFLRIFLSR